ncbi:MAG TPA: hypothetical protein VGW78_01560 [Candidatus Babeliales bacterium]|jgi:hypothetical protein|nr:hypothetical protein [Candidatus Babeliales bacterium]
MKLYTIFLIILVVHAFYSNTILSGIIIDPNYECPKSEIIQKDVLDIILFGEHNNIPSIQVQATPKKTISVNTILYATMVGYTLECIETKKRELQTQLNSDEPLLKEYNLEYNNNVSQDSKKLNASVAFLKDDIFDDSNALNYCSIISKRLLSNVDKAVHNAINNTNQAIYIIEQEQSHCLSVIKNSIRHWFGYPDAMQLRIAALVKSAHALLHIQNILAKRSNIRNALFGQQYLDPACTIKHTIKNCTRTGEAINTTYTNVQLPADAINHIISFLPSEDVNTYENDIKNMPGENLDIPEQDIVSCYQWSKPGEMWKELSLPQTTISFNKNEVGIRGTIGSVLYDHCHWLRMYTYNWVRFTSGPRLQPVYSNYSYKDNQLYGQDYGPFYREILGTYEKSPGSLYSHVTFDAKDSRYITESHKNRIYLMFPGETKIIEKEATIKIPNYMGQELYTETRIYKVAIQYDESEKGHGTTWVTRDEAKALFAADNKKHRLL